MPIALCNDSSPTSGESRTGAVAPGQVGVESINRRSFLGVLLGFGAVVVGAALSIPLLRFALHPLLTKTTDIGWSDIGKIKEFASLKAPMKKELTNLLRHPTAKMLEGEMKPVEVPDEDLKALIAYIRSLK